MRISSGIGDAFSVNRVADNAPAEGPQAPATSNKPAEMQSAVLQPAMAALKEMPEMDLDRIAMLRDALAKGELPFDPDRLAGLVQRFHMGTDK
ncbi:flagellar biosynthesis anti-sigma factor FlgM [Duganella sp. FT92W]|uniref:Flagellar biosynthesis anti-sigma factor FlgM n=1 Tax=Pseudoduganella rivuli TaxID=2666085 RepID=A0A7X2IRR3_9BURK|nr:flagellar biosynthesis anti-sigma factor FlgM [Pseudoduganella rivuli]MRV74814.1 flagellar biosynthesis anti-sigma factor FlgM [Pseudoduganella rivuli]